MATFTYADLIEWSRQLPAWQQDALRRILDEGVGSADVDDLVELAKAPHDRESDRRAQAPAAEGEPPADKPLPAVQLLAIRDIARVNALGVGPVEFASAGLTTVFGPNASGKSGIARILKKACRARDPGGPVRPNVFEDEPSEPAAATIAFQVDGSPDEHGWTDGGEERNPSPSDGQCVRLGLRCCSG